MSISRRSFLKSLPAFLLPACIAPGRTVITKKEYTVLLQQYPAAPLLVTTIKNTLGEAVWTRLSAGVYDLTMLGAFPLGKTFLPTVWHCVPNVIVVYAYRQDDDRVRMWVVDWQGNPLDDSISDMPFKVEVYP